MQSEGNYPVESTDRIASCLEYACLDAHASSIDLRVMCAEAEKFKIGSVLVNPVNVSETVNYLRGTGKKTDTVIAYPIGAYPPQIKQFEIRDAIENGANGITMLMAVGSFKDGFYDDIRAELDILASMTVNGTGRLMIEAKALTTEQQIQICQMTADAGVKTIVTATGFERGGFFEMDTEDVQQLVQATGGMVAIHAMKHQTTLPEVFAYLKAGAKKIITTSVREVMEASKKDIRDVVP